MEKVTFETAKTIQNALSNLVMECYQYGWSDDFKVKYIYERISQIKEEVYFIPFHEFDEDQLKQLGFRIWDDNLILCPLWIYEFLPFGLELECISGEKITVTKGYRNSDSCGYIDNDIRMGCISYGIRV